MMSGVHYAVPERPPSRRPLPQVSSEPPPPVLPPRPGGRGGSRPPQHNNQDDEVEQFEPDAVYDDCNENSPPVPLPARGYLSDPQETYDDFEEQKKPCPPGRPLPSTPLAKNEPEDFYDDCEEQKSSKRPQLPPHPSLPRNDFTEEVYDDCDEKPLTKHPSLSPQLPPEESYDDIGPVVVPTTHKKSQQQMPHRNLPPPPPSMNQYNKPNAADKPDNVYELSDVDSDDASNDSTSLHSAPPPLLPPKDNRSERIQNPPASVKPPAQTGGGFAIDLSQIANSKNKLRRVSEDKTNLENQATKTSPKDYADATNFSELQQKFKEKVDGKPENCTKPALPGKKPVINAVKPMIPPVMKSISNANSSKPPVSTESKVVSTPSPEKDLPAFPSTASVPLPPRPGAVIKQTPAPPVSVSKETFPKPSVEECDEIYDDAASEGVLAVFDWYHGDIDRKTGENRVKSIGKDGTFLVRVSKKDTKFPYTLVVYHKGSANNLHIRMRNDGKYALGVEKADELAFTDVKSMITHHQKHHVVLMTGATSQVILQTTPAKK